MLASGCARLARDDAVLLDAPALEAAVAALELRADAALVVAAADIAHCDQLERAAATAALAAAVVAATREAAVITMGDHAYEKGTREEFAQCYEPTWGRLNAVTYPSPGNHDFETDDGAPYYDYFAHYRRDPAARERGYYAFEIGGWQLLALNSLLPLEAGSAQLSWLEAELGRASGRCTLAYWHHPLASSGWHGLWPLDRGRDTRDAWRALLAHRAELVVNGHEHVYERYAPMSAELERDPDGLRQFIVGTGGGKLKPVLRRRAGSELVWNRTHGILVLVLHPDGYEWAFIGTDGVVRDRSDSVRPCR